MNTKWCGFHVNTLHTLLTVILYQIYYFPSKLLHVLRKKIIEDILFIISEFPRGKLFWGTLVVGLWNALRSPRNSVFESRNPINPRIATQKPRNPLFTLRNPKNSGFASRNPKNSFFLHKETHTLYIAKPEKLNFCVVKPEKPKIYNAKTDKPTLFIAKSKTAKPEELFFA